MAKNNRFNLPFRRRRLQKTNYKKRLALLKSRAPRLVVRKSNAHTVVQVVEYAPDGDRILAQASTVQLSELGWKGSCGNVPAAYLAGFVAGARAKKAGVSNVVVDLGMQEPFHGGRLFAAVKGAIDAGLTIPATETALPSDERVSGAHIDEKLPASVEAVKKKVGA
jgi:large subunit ribosomal protein L18